jgi:dTDP-4-amino-4,6-dideoxygalactose transaminase
MAIELTLQALNLTGEVITTPFTFASTTHAIVRNGLTPVFCDVNEDDYTIDVSKIESLITPKTTAILPVHVYGNICDVDAIRQIADKYKLKVIYDAAHTFGEKYKGQGIGSYGDVSCFSFHATKVFNTIEGGAVCFKNKAFGEENYNLKNFGIRGPEKVSGVGANAKMNEFCAAMGLCNLKHIDEEIAKRKVVVERYRENLDGVDGIKLSPIQDNVVSNYAYFPVVFDKYKFGKNRDEVSEQLAKNGIFSRKYFYPLTSAFECYSDRFNPNDTPIALDISKKILTLPLYANLSLEDVDRICSIILS